VWSGPFIFHFGASGCFPFSPSDSFLSSSSHISGIHLYPLSLWEWNTKSCMNLAVVSSELEFIFSGVFSFFSASFYLCFMSVPLTPFVTGGRAGGRSSGVRNGVYCFVLKKFVLFCFSFCVR
jgi:hypothetical protein